MIYYEDCRVKDARSNVLMEVETCSEGVFALVVGHGKSPCFSRHGVLGVSGVDWQAPFSQVVDGGNFLD